jgi:Tol biopolymer transport system component
MTTPDTFGRDLSRWLHEDAEHRMSDHLPEVLVRTAATRQRPWWSSPERWLPMESTLRLAPTPRIAWLLVVLALVVAIVAAIAIAGSQRRVPAPFGPAGNGLILSEGNDGDIYISNADGSHTRPLITDPAEDRGPWYTHAGTHFIFLRQASEIEQRIMIANADGSVVRQLTHEPLMYVDWYDLSPSDERLAIVHRFEGKRTLSILDMATGEVDHLTVPGLNVDNNVLWLPPDGEELIFTARPEFNSSTGAGLYRIRPDDTGFEEILPVRPEEWPYLGLEIAPDGSRLTYWQYEADDSADKWGAHVHVVGLATGDDTRMEFDPANEDESELRFSPDGTTGAILAADADGAYVQLVDLTGSKPPRRVGPDLVGNEPKAFGFSPDGAQVIFSIDNDEPWFVDVATGEVTTGPDTWSVYSSWQRLAR